MNKFYRTEKYNRVIFGVCGGLGNYTKIDPILWRLLFLGLIFTPFPIILLYLLTTILTQTNLNE
jgi:phage shock protein PspC (stress-responsive transcriptional regulator)